MDVQASSGCLCNFSIDGVTRKIVDTPYRVKGFCFCKRQVAFVTCNPERTRRSFPDFLSAAQSSVLWPGARATFCRCFGVSAGGLIVEGGSWRELLEDDDVMDPLREREPYGDNVSGMLLDDWSWLSRLERDVLLSSRREGKFKGGGISSASRLALLKPFADLDTETDIDGGPERWMLSKLGKAGGVSSSSSSSSRWWSSWSASVVSVTDNVTVAAVVVGTGEIALVVAELFLSASADDPYIQERSSADICDSSNSWPQAT